MVCTLYIYSGLGVQGEFYSTMLQPKLVTNSVSAHPSVWYSDTLQFTPAFLPASSPLKVCAWQTAASRASSLSLFKCVLWLASSTTQSHYFSAFSPFYFLAGWTPTISSSKLSFLQNKLLLEWEIYSQVATYTLVQSSPSSPPYRTWFFPNDSTLINFSMEKIHIRLHNTNIPPSCLSSLPGYTYYFSFNLVFLAFPAHFQRDLRFLAFNTSLPLV